MKSTFPAIIVSALLLTGCANEFNQVYKTSDYAYKYEYAKESFLKGKYTRATTLLQDLVTLQKGTDNAQESLYMLAMAQYMSRDYESAAATFKKYFTSYPKGVYAEKAEFYVGQSLYMSTPEPRLDQTQTVAAIAAFQDFLDLFPDAEDKERAQKRLFELQDKLVLKELENAQLYYNLGNYMGNNYESAIITARNAIKDYPYSKYKEQLEMIILKSLFKEAEESVNERKDERYRLVIDEYYAFTNDYPESKSRKEADNIFKIANNFVNKK